MRWIGTVALLTCYGCGGGQAHDELDEHAEHHGEGGEQHEHEFPPAVAEFHEAFAPLWHADAGPERTEETCAQVDALKANAAGVVSAPVPEEAAEDEAGWRDATANLASSLGALEIECIAEERPGFEERLTAVHEAFHGLVERVGHRD